jgi:hypothetical protein
MKFYTHIEKYVSMVSTNFEIDRTCESTADLKRQQEIGVLLEFSISSSNLVLLKSQTQSTTTECKQWSKRGKSHQPIPNQILSKESNVFHKIIRGEGKNSSRKRFQILERMQNWDWSRTLWAGPTTLPWIKLEDQEHNRQFTKSLWIPRLNWCLPREKTRSARISALNKW